jgi:hypothetical protein
LKICGQIDRFVFRDFVVLVGGGADCCVRGGSMGAGAEVRVVWDCKTGADSVFGTDPSIKGSIDRISCSIGRSLRSTGGIVTVGIEGDIFWIADPSPASWMGVLIFAPHRLQ